jgi:hypothetical protein
MYGKIDIRYQVEYLLLPRDLVEETRLEGLDIVSERVGYEIRMRKKVQRGKEGPRSWAVTRHTDYPHPG